MTSEIEWPSNIIEWHDSHNNLLPIMRGVREPVKIDYSSLNITFIKTEYLGNKHYGNLEPCLDKPISLWDDNAAAENTSEKALATLDFNGWTELFVQILCLRAEVKPYTRDFTTLEWAVENCNRHRSLAHTVALIVHIIDTTYQKNNNQYYNETFIKPVRNAIASSSEESHDEVIAFLEENANSSPILQHYRALWCPHVSEWAAISLKNYQFTYGHYSVGSCALPLKLFSSPTLINQGISIHDLALQVYLNGPEALALVEKQLELRSPEVQHYDNRPELTDFVAQLDTPQSIEILSNYFEVKNASKHLEKYAKKYPAAVLKCMIQKVITTPTVLNTNWTIRLAMSDPGVLTLALNAIDKNTAAEFKNLLPTLDTQEANKDELPNLLQSPPWLEKKAKNKTKPLALPELENRDAIEMTADDITVSHHDISQSNDVSPEQAFENLHIAPDVRNKLMQGEIVNVSELNNKENYRNKFSIHQLPLETQLPAIAAIAITNSIGGSISTNRYSLARDTKFWYFQFEKHGPAVLPGFTDYVQSNAETGLAIARPVSSIGVARAALHAMHKLVKAKTAAKTWLTAHPNTACVAAIPDALGKASVKREAARQGLRWLSSMGFDDVINEVAKEYGPDAEQALETLQKDALLNFPSRIPKLPDFFVASSMRRPLLKDNGQSLPLESIEHIATMLAISNLDASYAGIDIVKQTCTSASLAEFAWDIYTAWRSANAPNNCVWALHALGHLGNDDTADELLRLIKIWPTEGLQRRALAGIDVLALIGSDKSFTHLNELVAKMKRKGLRERAEERLSEVAAKLGLSSEQLSDRLVPTFGLDNLGKLDLDFGPRHFAIGFDENLVPFVTDETGTRLKTLPKPRQSDDIIIASDSTKAFRKLKKDAKAVASLQIHRFEAAMCSSRRWTLEECQRYVLKHPVMYQLASRLVWGVYENDKLIQTFRVAEDYSYADANDEQLNLTDKPIIGIAHPLELKTSDKAKFGELFSDYEIMQPFPQLARETFTLDAAELEVSTLTRFAAKSVASGSVVGLSSKGWDRGNAEDGGRVNYYSKRFQQEFIVQLNISPGIPIGLPELEPVQSLPELLLKRTNNSSSANFDTLTPISRSELIRDIQLLPPYKK